MMLGLWKKQIKMISFSVAAPQGRRRLEPLEFSIRIACLVTIIVVLMCTGGLSLLAKLGFVTDLVNGLFLSVTLGSAVAFTVTFLVSWLNAKEVQLLAQSHERFLHLSHTDALTGLSNRLGLYAACAELGSDYCVAFLDIDHFKSVNDTYSHLVGDLVISRVARTIREHFDADAHVARLGGEEFVVVQEIGRLAFTQMCEKVRAAIATTPVEYQDLQIPVTISIGVAFRGDAEIFDKVMHDADLALYRAKGGGRNRVCLTGYVERRQAVA
ncbi:GGDEF domain-containing protein [Agrobacterium pusense]|uniref:GGDEF domain-containing protein n=1 Tax=Agrobacterium pusense TaxID=648995 RepID=UPI002414F1C6|nr:GGDEF domain-containing protein [Agrobacterium pusense]WFN85322.1 GGDEF domain-containing protein [Agrobacterium pusense]